MNKLQDQILRDQAVMEVLNSPGADGWLGWTFHGYDSMESRIRLLCEKGVEANHPVLACALESLEKDTDRLDADLEGSAKSWTVSVLAVQKRFEPICLLRRELKTARLYKNRSSSASKFSDRRSRSNHLKTFICPTKTNLCSAKEFAGPVFTICAC
jgi:hypothetical protein